MIDYKYQVSRALWSLSPRIYVSLVYWRRRRRWPNLRHPANFSELVLSQIVSGEIVKVSQFADKLLVREHLTTWGYGELLPQVYASWSKVEAIDFSKLPESFVLKSNNGSGSHYFCHGKQRLNEAEAIVTMKRALEANVVTMEPQYAAISPKIFAEELIPDLRGGGRPLDYKFMCSGGKVHSVLVCSERDTGTKLATFDLNWNRQDFLEPWACSDKEFDRPEALGFMTEVAADIASRFKQVRVDFYCLPDGQVYIGELTFTPQGGFVRYFNERALVEMFDPGPGCE